MTFKNSIKQVLSRVFSLDETGGENAGNYSRFIINCVAWVIVIRLALVAWIIIIPDSRGYNSIASILSPPLQPTGNTNDAYFYWIIANFGFTPPSSLGLIPAGSLELVNFSPVYPAILYVTKFVFQDATPFVVNTIFNALTPLFLVGFLRNVVKDETTMKKMAIAILFNPIFMAYSMFGLTEPLHYLLLFIVLRAHYGKGLFWRIVEYAGLIVVVLNRFVAVVLAAFYVWLALFRKSASFRQRIILFLPALVMAATYLCWDYICIKLFGLTPDGARSIYWNHQFNLNPFAPGFIENQGFLLLAGTVLGLLVLVSTFSKNREVIQAETAGFERLDLQAFLAYTAATILFLGLQNQPISVLRYMGTLFPLYMVTFIKTPSSRLLSFASFAIVTGMVIANLAAMIVLSNGNPALQITALDIVLVTVFTIAFLGTSIMFYFKRDSVHSLNKLLAIQVLFEILLVPLCIYFP